MVLSEVLKDFSQETVIKVAAADGSSFFFIGNPHDLLKNMSAYNDACHEHAKKKLGHILNRYQAMIDSPPTMEHYFKENYMAEAPMSVDSYLNYCRLYFNKFYAIKDASLIEQKHLDNYTYLGDREVIETFKANPAVDNTTVIYITGYETGAYWMAEEAVNNPCCFRLVNNNLPDNEIEVQIA